MQQKHAIESINSIFNKYRQLVKQSGENYNIFKVLNVESNEVRLHSAFLADLLNPKGSHGFDSLFLRLFVTELNINNFDCQSVNVKVEQYIGKVSDISGGRIDIDIRDNNGYHIIIENKIYARDQENQLIRYFNYGENRCKNFKLFYLTLEGDMPDEEISCSDSKNGIKLEEGVDYFILSYRNDIKNWLEVCREKATNKPLLREGISHYINLIKHMTNQSLNTNMNEEVKKVLLKPDSVRNLANLKECILQVQIELQTQFWKTLINRLKSEGYDVSEKNISEKHINEYYTSSKNNKYYGIEIRFATNDIFSFRYGIRIDQNIYGGFTLREGVEKKNKINLKTEYKKYADTVKRIDANYENNDYWLGWKVMQPRLNFRNINEETCKNLSNLEETILNMVQNITDEIKFFKDTMNEN